MMGMGLLLILAGILGSTFWLYVTVGGAFGMTIFVLAYSYRVWRTEQDSK